ncbi:hypothetical protein [Pseudomonas sp.]|uniref:hypothetical protein n=1 Tax=Pseudomonas sp. TaxID=306 RepID=UPI0028B04007|nr:hypothetical protein [Pseudomonas sp.]
MERMYSVRVCFMAHCHDPLPSPYYRLSECVAGRGEATVAHAFQFLSGHLLLKHLVISNGPTVAIENINGKMMALLLDFCDAEFQQMAAWPVRAQ